MGMAVIIGDYEVIDRLGSGAMGDVFKGRNTKTNEIVAIKMLSEELSSNPRAVERFKREVQQTIKLKHPNLVAAFDSGEYKGRSYYVMEFVEGVTAKKELLSRGPYDEVRVLEIMIQICKALEYAAGFGIIHRDIKPDNIMITYDGKAKLCDMGLAKSTENETKLTLLGTVLGTPHYMSPEQARGDEKLDTRSDIFSLGSTNYHLLTGSPPFEGQDPISVMQALIEEDPTPIQDRNPKISDATCAVVAKMMEKDRNKRYQTFTEVLQDLYRIKRREMTTAQMSGSLPQSKIKLQKFNECFVPNETDVLVMQITMHNKLTTPEQAEICLRRQETLMMIGISLDISEVMVEMRFITQQQKTSLDKTKMQFMLDRGDDLFIKVCTSNNFLEPKEATEVARLKKEGQKGIGALLFSRDIIGADKREKIAAAIKHAMFGEEGKAILKIAVEANLISKPQAEKCSRIYSNNVVMGKYRDLCSILIEKGFLVPEAANAVLRAVRRSTLTGKSAINYIDEVKQN